MSNTMEILAPKIVSKYNSNILIERDFFCENKVNLSFQEYPEYTIGLFIKEDNGLNIDISVYSSDLKITEENSLIQKYHDMKQIGDLKIALNIVFVASYNDQNSEIKLNKFQVEFLTNSLKMLSIKYPEHFKNFDLNSKEYLEFFRTGNATILNKSNFPVVRYYRPIEFHKLPHDSKKFEKTSTYEFIKNQTNLRDNNKSNHSFSLNFEDDITF